MEHAPSARSPAPRTPTLIALLLLVSASPRVAPAAPPTARELLATVAAQVCFGGTCALAKPCATLARLARRNPRQLAVFERHRSWRVLTVVACAYGRLRHQPARPFLARSIGVGQRYELRAHAAAATVAIGANDVAPLVAVLLAPGSATHPGASALARALRRLPRAGLRRALAAQLPRARGCGGVPLGFALLRRLAGARVYRALAAELAAGKRRGLSRCLAPLGPSFVRPLARALAAARRRPDAKLAQGLALAFGVRALPVLGPLLARPDGDRAAVLAALSGLRHRRGRPSARLLRRLLPLTRHRDAALRLAAVRALDGHRRAKRTLLALAAKDADERVRDAALAALASLADRTLERTYLAAIRARVKQRGKQRLLRHLFRALARHPTPRATRTLLSLAPAHPRAHGPLYHLWATYFPSLSLARSRGAARQLIDRLQRQPPPRAPEIALLRRCMERIVHSKDARRLARLRLGLSLYRRARGARARQLLDRVLARWLDRVPATAQNDVLRALRRMLLARRTRQRGELARLAAHHELLRRGDCLLGYTLAADRDAGVRAAMAHLAGSCAIRKPAERAAHLTRLLADKAPGPRRAAAAALAFLGAAGCTVQLGRVARGHADRTLQRQALRTVALSCGLAGVDALIVAATAAGPARTAARQLLAVVQGTSGFLGAAAHRALRTKQLAWTRSRSRLPARGGHLDVGAVRLYYRLVGRGGVPLVILHGGPNADHRHLTDHFDHLGRRRRLVYYDQRWRGRSGGNRPITAFVGDQDLSDLARLLAHLKLRRVDLLGHSFGAMIAMRFAARHPDRVRRLVLSNMPWPTGRSYTNDIRAQLAPFLRGERGRLHRWIHARRAELGEDLFSRHKALLESAFYLQGDPRKLYRLHQLRLPAALLRQLFWGYRAFLRAGYVDQLKALKVPTLVLVGERDIFPRSHARRYRSWARAQPTRRRVHVQRGAGHMGFATRPKSYFAVVGRFLGQRRPAGRQRPRSRSPRRGGHR